MSESILIVIDMQNDFVTGTLGSKEAQAIVPNVLNKVLNHQGHILFTKDSHGEEYFKSNEGKNLPIEHCRFGTGGWHLVPQLRNLADETFIVYKTTFGYKDWDHEVWKNLFNEVDTIHLCGVCTDICVISNALILKAMYPEHRIIVDASCCAGVTPEKHKAALEVMKSCQIEVENEEG